MKFLSRNLYPLYKKFLIFPSDLLKFLYAALIEMGSFWQERKKNIYVTAASQQIIPIHVQATYTCSSEEKTKRRLYPLAVISAHLLSQLSLR